MSFLAVNVILIILQTLAIDVMVDVRVRVLAVMMMDAMEDVLVDAMEAEILTGGEMEGYESEFVCVRGKWKTSLIKNHWC